MCRLRCRHFSSVGWQGQAKRRRSTCVTLARLSFPEDPTFVVLLALTQAWDGDMAAARAELDRVRNQLGDRQMAAAKKFYGGVLGLQSMPPILFSDKTATVFFPKAVTMERFRVGTHEIKLIPGVGELG